MKRKDPDYSLLYAWWVSRSDEFPESTFVVNAVPVAVDHEADGQLMNAISASAVWTGEDGESYAWRVSRSDEFPESTFVLNAVPVAVEHEANAVLHEIPVLR